MTSERMEGQDQFVPCEGTEQHTAGTVSVKDLAQFLLDLGRMLGNPAVGNPALGDALRKLGRLLRQYSDNNLNNVLAGMSLGQSRQEVKRIGQVGQLEGLDIASLDLKAVREILDNQSLTKRDIVQLGAERFGISNSKLERLTRELAVEAVKAALSNAEALDIISEEARREGSRHGR